MLARPKHGPWFRVGELAGRVALTGELLRALLLYTSLGRKFPSPLMSMNPLELDKATFQNSFVEELRGEDSGDNRPR